MFKNIYDKEVSSYKLSNIEKDAYLYFSGKKVTAELIRSVRGGLMIYEALLNEFWKLGVRVRIAPYNSSCISIFGQPYGEKCNVLLSKNIAGKYLSHERIVIIKEESIVEPQSYNQRYGVIIHEFAHAIWYLILTQHERKYITSLYESEQKMNRCYSEYRMTNVREFFADGFVYFCTPKIKIRDSVRDHKSPDAENLWRLNPEFHKFLKARFGWLIKQELIFCQQQQSFEEEVFEMWMETGLYLPVINSY
jgi:hypothetical protein